MWRDEDEEDSFVKMTLGVGVDVNKVLRRRNWRESDEGWDMLESSVAYEEENDEDGICTRKNDTRHDVNHFGYSNGILNNPSA